MAPQVFWMIKAMTSLAGLSGMHKQLQQTIIDAFNVLQNCPNSMTYVSSSHASSLHTVLDGFHENNRQEFNKPLFLKLKLKLN
jgi:hypothetical protein